MISSLDSAPSPPINEPFARSSPPNPIDIGPPLVTHMHSSSAQSLAQASNPAYFVVEPPDSPRRELVLSQPNVEVLSPMSSPKSAKQNAFVDITLAHVFYDLSLKRKAPDDAIMDMGKCSKLQKALKDQMWTPIGRGFGEEASLSNPSNIEGTDGRAHRRIGRVRHFKSKTQA